VFRPTKRRLRLADNLFTVASDDKRTRPLSGPFSLGDRMQKHDTRIEELIALVADHAVARAAFTEALRRRTRQCHHSPTGDATTWKCDGPSRHGRLHHKRGHYGPDRLVMKLNTMETAIGIRANQLDAWRDFTDALLAVMERPRRAETRSTEEKPEPFARAQRLADDAIARAESAENLKKAIGLGRRSTQNLAPNP
jgi:hypothetical protein